MQQAKSRALDAQAHQDVPFEHVVERLKPPRSLSHTPIFQVMLMWQNNEEGRLDLPGLTLLTADAEYGVAKFDQELSLSEAGDRIEGSLSYATALFDRSTIERHVTYLVRVLEAMVNDPTQAVDRVDLLDDSERQRVLLDFNATQADYPQTACIHQLIEAQVARTPDAVAVADGTQSLSYRALNQQANQLAHHLIGLGVKPDDRVAICIERGVSMVVGVLAILKAGGAYVPMDPNYPADRLAYMVQDSAPVAVLTTESVRAALPDLPASLAVIDLQRDIAQGQADSVDNPDRNHAGLTSANLAYIIYTSGSTGMPKGVMIEHRQAVNFLCWADRTFDRDAFAHSLFSTSLNFDLSVYECFAPLSVGGCIHIVGNALGLQRDNPPVHLINTVPSALQAMLDAQAIGDNVRVVNVAGEPLKRELAERLFAQTKVQQLNNLYGPSETTTYSSGVTMTRESGFIADIGHPIANTQFYLLDAQRQPVPAGVVGEIYIGGAGVARGYLNRVELTEERFLPNPFIAGERMYKTGDIGRWLADGSIEYRGRNDFQVKIRGFRIELGEIEARLAEHPEVREAVVLAREDNHGDKQLVAYVTATNGATISTDSLRTHLGGTLPDYMVPAAYVALDAFPLTPNGKLDRKALPAPDTDAYISRAYEAAIGTTEQTLAQVWSTVLNVERAGRQDNFFELGGHSLLVLRMKNMLREAGIEISVADLFGHPSLAALAGAIDKRAVDVRHTDSAEALKVRGGTQTPLFLVHDGYGDVLYFSALAKQLPADLPVYGLPGVSLDDPSLRSMQAMAAHMIEMIQRVQPVGPYRLAGWSFGGVLAYEIATQLMDRGARVEFLGLIDAFHPQHAFAGDVIEQSPVAVLRELCEEGTTELPVPEGDFDTLFKHYREHHALPDNFVYLTAKEAYAQCRSLTLNALTMHKYLPQPVDIGMHLFTASVRPAGFPKVPSPSLGWERCIDESQIRVQAVPGTHQSMMKSPHIQELGQYLTEALKVESVDEILG